MASNEQEAFPTQAGEQEPKEKVEISSPKSPSSKELYVPVGIAALLLLVAFFIGKHLFSAGCTKYTTTWTQSGVCLCDIIGDTRNTALEEMILYPSMFLDM
jgi:hypothetical protein